MLLVEARWLPQERNPRVIYFIGKIEDQVLFLTINSTKLWKQSLYGQKNKMPWLPFLCLQRTCKSRSAFSPHSRPTLSIQHPPSAAISIQRPAQSRDVTTRITLPSHPALGTPKQQLHTMAQVKSGWRTARGCLRINLSHTNLLKGLAVWNQSYFIDWIV